MTALFPRWLFHEKITRNQLLILLGAIGVLLLLRWNTLAVPYERDEGEYAYSAWLLRHHEMPYHQAFLQKPPLIVYVFLISQFISDDSTIPPRIFALLSLILTLLLTGKMIARERGLPAGLMALWLMVPMLCLPALAPFAANTEIFMILPMVGLLFLHQKDREKPERWHWLLAGCCAAVACLFKPIVAPVILFVMVVWVVETKKTIHASAKMGNFIGLFLLGSIGTTLVFLSPFLLYDGGSTLWECVVQYNLEYAGNEGTQASTFVFFLNIFWSEWWILVLLLVWYIAKRPSLSWFYLGLLAAALLPIFQTPQGHYYIMIIPILASIAAISLDVLVTQILKKKKRETVYLYFAFSVFIVGILTVPSVGLALKSPSDIMKVIYGEQNPFLEAPVAGQAIAALTKPDQAVFVAGSEPEVLYYARRKSPSRFVIMYPMMIPTPVALRYQQETRQILEQHSPEIIVFVRAPTSWALHPASPRLLVGYLNQIIKQRYEMIGGVRYAEKDWIDHPNEAQYNQCSMVVYRKSQKP